MLFPARLSAQAVTFTVTVEDASGAAISAAVVEDAAGRLLGRTDADGRLTLSCVSLCKLRVQAPGFQGRNVQLSSGATLRLESVATEQVTVTAYRSPLGMLESPATTRLLTQANLSSTAAVTLVMTPDNESPITLTFPSTSGAQVKQFLTFPPNKFKIVGWTANSSQPFTIYAAGCEVMYSGWGVKSGPIKPFEAGFGVGDSTT